MTCDHLVQPLLEHVAAGHVFDAEERQAHLLRWQDPADGPHELRARTEGHIDELTDEHWTVVRFMREKYTADGSAPSIRSLGKESGISTRDLYRLFPRGPAKVAALIGGIPKPDACV